MGAASAQFGLSLSSDGAWFELSTSPVSAQFWAESSLSPSFIRVQRGRSVGAALAQYEFSLSSVCIRFKFRLGSVRAQFERSVRQVCAQLGLSLSSVGAREVPEDAIGTQIGRRWSSVGAQ